MFCLLNRWWFGKEDRIVIDVQDSRVVLVSQGVGLKDAMSAVVRELPAGVVQRGLLVDTAALVETVKECLVDVQPRYTRLAAVLSPRASLCVDVTRVTADHLNGCEYEEMSVSERFSLDSKEYHHRTIPYRTHDGQEGHVVIATRRAVLETWHQLARLLGVELVAVVPRAYALLPRLRKDRLDLRNELIVVIDLTEAAVSLQVYADSRLIRAVVLEELAWSTVHAPLCEIEREMGPQMSDRPKRFVVFGEVSGPHRAPLDDLCLKLRGAGSIERLEDVTASAQALLEFI